jgi:regulator of sirC expression with transglutaminase-like and TPR domain
LAAQARALPGANADDAHKLAAVRTMIYQPGAWNNNQAFAYDHADPLGHDIRNKLLATYLRTRLGNCVSMPILFLLLADKLGVNVSLARAPHHLLVRWRQASGHELNLECTSGGLPARDVYYRESLPPITDAAIANGVYLRSLSRRENVAAMATTVAEYFYGQRRFQDAIDVCAAILAASPHDAATMVLEASSHGGLIHDEFEQRFPTPALIPPNLRARYSVLEAANERLFAQAEALGWRESP